MENLSFLLNNSPNDILLPHMLQKPGKQFSRRQPFTFGYAPGVAEVKRPFRENAPERAFLIIWTELSRWQSTGELERSVSERKKC